MRSAIRIVQLDLTAFPQVSSVGGIGTSLVQPEAAWRMRAASRAQTYIALPFGETHGARDPRTLAILAKTIYRELRNSGFESRDVIAVVGEMLAQVTSEVSAARLDAR
jgi:hypothetical protein